ncbi:hypothetical protein C8Q74DRAFT_1362484 [Fomes fomentarius]|nr:hypothetical protein C8Q74DRAFT_1362484 [Fomes fomentarius]
MAAALPTVEVAFAPATEAFRANPRDLPLVKPTLEILNKADGQIKSWYGIQHEDKQTAYVLVEADHRTFVVAPLFFPLPSSRPLRSHRTSREAGWETLAHHHNLINDEVAYPPLVSAIGAMFDVSKIGMFHVAFTSEPYRAIEAPVLEIAMFEVREGESKDALEKIVDALAKGIEREEAQAAGAVGAAWGPTVENDKLVVLFIGWTSVEAHYSFVKGDQFAIDLIRQAREISTGKAVHIPLAGYPKA